MVEKGYAHVEPAQAAGAHPGGKLVNRGRGTRILRPVRDGDERTWPLVFVPGFRRYSSGNRGQINGATPDQTWMPHSVLPVPAHRPLRGSEPGSTRRVQVRQPIDG